MSIFSKLFGKKNAEEAEGTVRVGGMEDFMTLIRVYYQAVMAAQLGISNINFLPDMAVFKRTLKIPTQNNKLGIAEKSRCKKMVMEIYGINESFFKEIDASIKKNCKNVNDIKNYLFMFQGFSQDLMMLIGNLMQWKFRLPAMMTKLLRNMTEKTVHDILTKTETVYVKPVPISVNISMRWVTRKTGSRNMSITSSCWPRKSRNPRLKLFSFDLILLTKMQQRLLSPHVREVFYHLFLS